MLERIKKFSICLIIVPFLSIGLLMLAIGLFLLPLVVLINPKVMTLK